MLVCITCTCWESLNARHDKERECVPTTLNRLYNASGTRQPIRTNAPGRNIFEVTLVQLTFGHGDGNLQCNHHIHPTAVICSWLCPLKVLFSRKDPVQNAILSFFRHQNANFCTRVYDGRDAYFSKGLIFARWKSVVHELLSVYVSRVFTYAHKKGLNWNRTERCPSRNGRQKKKKNNEL